MEDNGPFLDNDHAFASPPWTNLGELENASLQLERKDVENDSEYSRWIRMLVCPGGSLGGARPKASICDLSGALWIAKFPSIADEYDMGLWEMVVYDLAEKCQIKVSKAKVQKFNKDHTFIVKRFDRTETNSRIFYMSAMTALERLDGDSATDGASYLDIAEFLIRYGANIAENLRELWSRIAFNILVSNTDDYLRNHGFILQENGWELSPAFDLNANADGNGLRLNISENDNSQDLKLLLSVAKNFRMPQEKALIRLNEIRNIVSDWRKISQNYGISASQQASMARAFRLV